LKNDSERRHPFRRYFGVILLVNYLAVNRASAPSSHRDTSHSSFKFPFFLRLPQVSYRRAIVHFAFLYFTVIYPTRGRILRPAHPDLSSISRASNPPPSRNYAALPAPRASPHTVGICPMKQIRGKEKERPNSLPQLELRLRSSLHHMIHILPLNNSVLRRV
jgi:hypothetical protein